MIRATSKTSDVLESFRRIRGDRLVERFYERLLAADERIQRMFAQTDFSRQKQMLQHGILMMLNHTHGDAIGGITLRRLGQYHNGKVGVTPDMYKLFVDCMVKSAKELDPEWTPRLDLAWRRELEIGLAKMQEE